MLVWSLEMTDGTAFSPECDFFSWQKCCSLINDCAPAVLYTGQGQPFSILKPCHHLNQSERRRKNVTLEEMILLVHYIVFL